MTKNTTENQIIRSEAQNRAIHKLFKLWADELNRKNKSIFDVIKDEVEIPWYRHSVYENLWKPLKKVLKDFQKTYEKMQDILEKHIEVDKLPDIQALSGETKSKKRDEYLKLVAEALNDAGADMRVYFPKGDDVWWTKDLVKDLLWRPVQIIKTGEESTKYLLKKDVDPIYDIITRHLGKHIETISFPSIQELINKEYDKER